MSNCCDSRDGSFNHLPLMSAQIVSLLPLLLGWMAGPSFSWYGGILVTVLHHIQWCFVNKIMVAVLAVLSLIVAGFCFAEAAGSEEFWVFIFIPPVNYVTGAVWVLCAILDFLFVFKKDGNEEGVNNCQCCSNKNGAIIAAQVLSIFGCAVGFVPGYFAAAYDWFLFIVFVTSLIVFLFHQVLWCVIVPKSFHWVLGFASLFVAGGNIYGGIRDMIPIINFEPDDDTVYVETGVSWFIIGLHFASALFWLIVTILELVFVCKKGESKDSTGDDEKDGEAVAVAVAVPAKEDV